MSQLAAQNNLPRLPGVSFGEEMLKPRYHKTQVLASNLQGAPQPKDRPEFETQSEALPRALTWRYTSSSKQSHEVFPVAGEDQTKRVSLERKVLRFKAFFREPTFNSAVEQHRVRMVYIHYHLEDDTIAVVEPRQDNSGIAQQGTFLKRHNVIKPDGQNTFNFDDFNIGVEVNFYQRCFKIIDCDAFTRSFLLQLGKEVPEALPMPIDQYTVLKKTQAETMKPYKQKKGNDVDYIGGNAMRNTLGAAQIAKTMQFLERDKQILKFHCIWDDREMPHGDLRHFKLFYFLADDTINITEVDAPNSGRDPFPAFVKRGKVPKPIDGRYQNPTSSLVFKSEIVQYYTDKDLRIGERLNIYGRELVIHDCDDFTKQYLSQTYGVEEFNPLSIENRQAPYVAKDPPPHIGFGVEEDSILSCKFLVPNARLIKTDQRKAGYGNEAMLKFLARFDDGDASNSVRKFVITFYLCDDTISIFETLQRNTGITGGKFLNRQRVKKVNSEDIPTGTYLQAEDFFVGNRLTINTHRFLIYDTDERSLKWMEEHPDTFPMSNVNIVLTRIRRQFAAPVASALAVLRLDDNGSVPFPEFARALERCKLPFTEHELLTVARFFDRNGDGRICAAELREVIAAL